MDNKSQPQQKIITTKEEFFKLLEQYGVFPKNKLFPRPYDQLKEEYKNEKIPYAILLRTVEWEDLRKKIISRDDNKCKDCFISSDSLEVHHNYYIIERLPWNYDDNCFVALCKDCHIKRHEKGAIPVFTKDDLLERSHNLIVCDRCNGRGWFEEYSHVENGVCFKCLGEKYIEIKNVFSDTIIATGYNLEADGFKKKISSTGTKQFVKQIDGNDIIIHVKEFKETYKLIKRVANFDYKSMKVGQFFIIGI